MPDPRRVVVCGTRFGEHYLAALTRRNSDYVLAGILARGSGRSRALAGLLGVPLYSTVDDVPSDVGTACVVVRSAIVGGRGSELALGLLDRGLHVLQEHPLHPSDVVRMKAVARARGVRYHVHTLYAGAPAGLRFIEYARRSADKTTASFLEITTSLQLLYSSLDLAGRALGPPRPFACAGPLDLAGIARASSSPWPFRSLQGVFGAVPFSLHLQTYLDPRDPDHHSLVMHRIAAGGPEGHVLMAGSFGPVVWNHSIHAPDYDRDDAGASYLVAREEHMASRHNRTPTAITFGAAQAPSLAEAVQHDIPSAILRALDDLTSKEEPPWQTEEYWRAHGEAWLGIMRAVGDPAKVALPLPPAPFPDPVAYARACAEESAS